MFPTGTSRFKGDSNPVKNSVKLWCLILILCLGELIEVVGGGKLVHFYSRPGAPSFARALKLQSGPGTKFIEKATK